MELDINELTGYLQKGKLTQLPSKRKKKLFALARLSEHISADRIYSEKEFNELLNELHTFKDPATLRRELYDYFLINRGTDGKEYRLNPDRPSLAELLKKYYSESDAKKTSETVYEKDGRSSVVNYSERDSEDAADFRNRIHAEALQRIQRIRPEITSVIDRYPVEAYFQQVWDYPGTWYTIVAIPEDVRSKEALIDIIVRDTLKEYQTE